MANGISSCYHSDTMTKSVLLRMPLSLHARAVAVARADRRSFNSWAITVIAAALEGYEPDTQETESTEPAWLAKMKASGKYREE